jgi:hypothetical protein
MIITENKKALQLSFLSVLHNRKPGVAYSLDGIRYSYQDHFVLNFFSL